MKHLKYFNGKNLEIVKTNEDQNIMDDFHDFGFFDVPIQEIPLYNWVEINYESERDFGILISKFELLNSPHIEIFHPNDQHPNLKDSEIDLIVGLMKKYDDFDEVVADLPEKLMDFQGLIHMYRVIGDNTAKTMGNVSCSIRNIPKSLIPK